MDGKDHTKGRSVAPLHHVGEGERAGWSLLGKEGVSVLGKAGAGPPSAGGRKGQRDARLGLAHRPDFHGRGRGLDVDCGGACAAEGGEGQLDRRVLTG